MALFEEFAGTCGKDAAPLLPNPPSVGFGLNHVHNLAHTVCRGLTNCDARTRNRNLRFQELKLSVIARPKPLQSQGQERQKEMDHSVSFRSVNPARGRGSTWCYMAPEFPYPQERGICRNHRVTVCRRSSRNSWTRGKRIALIVCVRQIATKLLPKN